MEKMILALAVICVSVNLHAADFNDLGVKVSDLRTAASETRQFPAPSAAEKSGQAKKPLTLTESDSHITAALSVGQELRVRIANPISGGYLLLNPVYDRTKLTFVGRVLIAPTSGMFGDFGSVEFRFLGAAAGASKLNVYAKRPWEADLSAVEVFTATVDAAERAPRSDGEKS